MTNFIDEVLKQVKYQPKRKADSDKGVSARLPDELKRKFAISLMYLGESENSVVNACVRLFVNSYEEKWGQIRLPERKK